MAQKSVISWIASILVVIGAINWGLVGIGSFSAVSYDWDLVALLLGGIPWLAAAVYILVGLSGIWLLLRLFK
jgi:uncharacterized protein